MAQKIIIFFLLIITPHYTPNEQIHFFVVWNVGQGSWNTYVTEKSCLHFDMGGEFFPKKLLNLCLNKKNELILSHWDKDHYSFIFRFSKMSNLCLRDSPPLIEKKLQYKFKSLSKCNTKKKFSELYRLDDPFKINYDNKNDSSLIYSFKNILIPGDITSKREQKLVVSNFLNTIQKLIVPHHGSKTSTTRFLLEKLPSAKQAIVSARKEKYGHPHKSVKKRLKDHSLSLITTQDWGDIYLQL